MTPFKINDETLKAMHALEHKLLHLGTNAKVIRQRVSNLRMQLQPDMRTRKERRL